VQGAEKVVHRGRQHRGEASRVLVLDSENPAAMAVAVPILLVDLLEDLKAEPPGLFEVDRMRKAIEKLVPWVGGQTPS
jgi:hypothetical protein